MPEALFYPLDRIKPDQLLSQYSDWIYFTLVLVFFISLAGITLRKHFDRPYVKPLIISVGIMLTVGVFTYKKQLVLIFEGWGIVGLILLVILVATIPFNLCRGYGMPAKKAFYLTYILFYIVAWASFPQVFYSLSNRNLGLVNLALLIVFIAAIIKTVPFKRSKTDLRKRWKEESPFESEIKKNIGVEKKERDLVKSRIGQALNVEIRTIQDMAEALAKIQQLIESTRNNFSAEERKKVGDLFDNISNKEELFKKVFLDFQKTAQQISLMDEKQLNDLKSRFEKATEKEKQIIQAEIQREEEKIRIHKTIRKLEENLPKSLETFKQSIRMAAENMKDPQRYYTAKENIANARSALVQIFEMIERMQGLEKKMLDVLKIEKALLKKEKRIA